MLGADYSLVSVGRKRIEEEARKDRALGENSQRFKGAYAKNEDFTPIIEKMTRGL